jgi:alcohol dehydrogenase (NADP+)
MVDSCRHCLSCQEELEHYCAKGLVDTYGAKLAGGSITQGGYSTHIVVNENYVLHMPPHLPLAASAPLLCAGITLYSPLAHWNVGHGSKVAIVGLGGLGHIGVKLSHTMGVEVSVLLHSSRKKEEALKMGATHFYETSRPETFESLRSQFDLIINTVSAELDWNAYLSLLKRDASMVIMAFLKRRFQFMLFL